jgi:hypothetical protein
MKKGRTVQGWHFVNGTLRDGRPIPADGEVLRYTGPLVMCESGLHASKEPFDALQYAPGPTLCLVNCAGEIVEGDDKLICTERTIIARMDATDLLRYFARMQALSVIHLWDTEPQDVVLDFLMTGDESLRAAAGAAARAAAWAAAWAAAGDAAWAAARAAAGAAARAAAWAAAGAAARKDFNGLVRECFWEHL